MDQASARQALGVDAESAASDILAAYGRRSRRLKRRFMEAVTVEARDRARRALRNLGILRDLAVGARDARELRMRRAAERPVLVDDWWRPEDGVPMAVPDRPAALRWLGVGEAAAPPSIRRILDARARQIKLCIARATTEYTFSIRPPEENFEDIFLVGAFNDWELSLDYKMNESGGVYSITIPLKRGIYDYQYVAADVENGVIINPDWLVLEGNTWLNSNEYDVFFYYNEQDKGPYERIMGYKRAKIQ